MVLVVAPSPKSQNRLVIVPVELSTKLTNNGLMPEVVGALNAATGKMAPEPETELVEEPPLLSKRTALLAAPSAVGVKLTAIELVCPGATLKESGP